MANIPKSWADVTHKQYYNLVCTPSLSFTPLSEQLREVLMWVSDSSEQEIYALSLVQLAEIANEIAWIFEPMQPKMDMNFTHKEVEYYYNGFMNEPLIKLILNQEMKHDSEIIANEVQANDYSSVPKILALWACEKGEEGFDMGKVSHREKAFETVGVNILAGFYNFYVLQLVQIREYFKELFKDTYMKGSENFKHILDRYGWEISVSDLANADVTKYEGVRLTPIFDALTQLEIRKLTAIANENINRQREN